MYYSNILKTSIFRVGGFCKKRSCLCKFEKGNIMINSVTSLTLVFILFCVIHYSVSMRLANEASVQLEDGLTASCMAGLNIDLQRFSDTIITGKTDVVVKDATLSYNIFKETLSENIASGDRAIIHDIEVKQYIVYNVYWDRTDVTGDNKIVDIYYFDKNGLINEVHKPYEAIYSPNGIKVTKTSVYADINFVLDIYTGEAVDCHKQLLTQAYKK